MVLAVFIVLHGGSLRCAAATAGFYSQELMGMDVQPSWTGADIAEFIQRNLNDRPGLRLTYMVCDQGTNILAALRQLAIPVVSDCSHVMMNLVKKLFTADTALSNLSAEVGKLRQ